MCNLRLRTDDLMDMISSIVEKKAKVQGNLRLEALLKCTYKLLDHELKENQTSRKRKLLEIITQSKKTKCNNNSVFMEDDPDNDILGLDDFFNCLKSLSVKNL